MTSRFTYGRRAGRSVPCRRIVGSNRRMIGEPRMGGRFTPLSASGALGLAHSAQKKKRAGRKGVPKRQFSAYTQRLVTTQLKPRLFYQPGSLTAAFSHRANASSRPRSLLSRHARTSAARRGWTSAASHWPSKPLMTQKSARSTSRMTRIHDSGSAGGAPMGLATTHST